MLISLDFLKPYGNCIKCQGKGIHPLTAIYGGGKHPDVCYRCEGRGVEPVASCIICQRNLWLDESDDHDYDCEFNPFYKEIDKKIQEFNNND